MNDPNVFSNPCALCKTAEADCPSRIFCPFCGIQDVAIDSDDFKKIEEAMKE
ncbi:hypothetical protein CHCC15543_2690 [Bacillus licheniformis]|nr:hypothetical protein CHCC15543_2690 [Bacillus licheniformis]